MKALAAVLAVAVFAVLAWFGWAAQHTTASGATALAPTVGPVDIPAQTMQAYVAAAAAAPAECRMRWPVLAGFGAIESGHGTYKGDGKTRTINVDGTVTPPIIGPALDGGSFALIWDSDGGRYDGDTVYDRAVGPTQFLPATWEAYEPGRDPQNIDAAASATMKKVCSDAGGSVEEADNLTEAVYRYNPSMEYVRAVIDRVDGYDQWASTNPGTAPQPATPARVDEPALADIFRAMGDSGQRRWTALGDLVGADGAGGVLDQAYGYVDPAVRAALDKMTPNDAKLPEAEPAAGQRDDTSAGKTAVLPGLPGSEGFQPYFAQRLVELVKAAPGSVTIRSGYRSTAEQQSIIDRHGGECGVWVACVTGGVCGSMHCKGLAADLTFENGNVREWVHAHVADYGLTFPMDYEAWHVEPIGARG